MKESMKNSIGVGNENVRTSISRDEAEKIFLKKMKEAEETVNQGEYMTSEQAHTFLGV